MSAMGQKETYTALEKMSALAPLPDIRIPMSAFRQLMSVMGVKADDFFLGRNVSF
jgi:hypothetical protein